MLDKGTIKACMEGDQRAYKDVYGICAPYVFSIVRNYFVEQEDRKDAMQEVFAHLFVSMKNYDENKGSFKSWLSKLVVFQCINLIKKSTTLFVSFPPDLEEVGSETALDTLHKLSTQDLDNMFSIMPSGYRTIFLLSVIDEYTHKEIGEMLGIAPETSRSQLMRAIKWIKTNILTEAKMMQYGLL